MRGRAKWIAIGAVIVAGIATAGTWRYVEHRHRQPEAQIHDTAAADAAEKVDRVRDTFVLDHLYKAADYAHSAGQLEDVEVLSVAGETHWQTGVILVLQVTGHGRAIGADRSVIREGDVPICFRIQLGPKKDSQDDDVDCPPGPPTPIAQDPSLQGVDDQLRRVLDAVGPREPAVRAAVAGMNLDPAIHQDYVARDDTVGVALKASQYDCVIVRITATDVKTWRPSHTQLAPGELSCSAGLAFGSAFDALPR